MPKYVDHEQRRQELLAALWRVVERDGAGGLSIRSLAAEAKVSKTNVAYYFPSRLAILMAASEQVAIQVGEAISAEFMANPSFESAVDALTKAVPTNPMRRRQSEVWLMLLIEGAQSPDAATILDAFNDQLFVLYRNGFEMMIEAGFIDPTIDLEIETTRIQALIDGLSLHTISDRSRTDEARVRAVVTAHLRSLAPTKVPEGLG